MLNPRTLAAALANTSLGEARGAREESTRGHGQAGGSPEKPLIASQARRKGAVTPSF
jgi:hypothetical protein